MLTLRMLSPLLGVQDEDLVYHKATSYRHRLVTAPSGKISIEMSVITRYLNEYGVDSA